ncbi:MAG TPA: AAA family ATPase [Tepidiformaceae bacterium]|nr:AAA family ATPase [Tepidiformaceae bacterium]
MALRPHKVTATILFTDLIRSTEFVEQAGDDRAERVISTHKRILGEAAAAHGGDVVKTMGDGLMVAFRSATDALAAAMEMQEAARSPVGGESLQLQAGLNAGDLVVDGDDYFGLHVVIAERLCKLAPPGKVLCSGSVMALLGGQTDFEFRDIGLLQLKGVAMPVQAYEVGLGRRSVAERLARMPVVGRGNEVEQLEQRLGEAIRGRGSVALITGEPGIGKTRTAEEVESVARGVGAVTAWARCYSGDGHGQAAIASMVESLCRQDGGKALGRLPADDVGELQRLAPSLATGGGVSAVSEEGEPGSALSRLAESTGRLLAEVCADAPALLVFDDVQWAAAETVAVVRHLARMAPRHRLQLLATCRDGEIDPGRPVAELLSTLPRETDLLQIHLEGLPAEDVTTFVRTVADDVPAAFGEALAHHTGGNPYFIREVLLNLAAERDGGWPSPEAVDRLGITRGMRQVTLRRVNQLSEDARKFLTAAAAFEADFSLEAVQRVTELKEEPALDAIDESMRAQLIRPGQGLDTYEFTHWIIGQALCDSLSPSRLARLHRDIAEALQAANANVRQVGFHLRAAGGTADPQLVASMCLAAGEAAATALSYEEAIADFGAAAKAAEASHSRMERADALHGLGRAQGELGRWEEALTNIDLAHNLYRELGSSAKLAEGLYYRARLLYFQVDLGAAGAALAEARDVILAAGGIDEDERKRILARVLELSAQTLFLAGQSEEAQELASEAMALAEALENPSLLAQTLFARGWIRFQRLQVSEAIEDLARYRELARSTNYPLQDLVGAVRGGLALFVSGDIARAREWLVPAQEQCESSGKRRDGAYACVPLAAAALLAGDVAGANAQATRGLAIGDSSDPFIANGLLPIQAYAASLKGDQAEALRVIEALLTPEERAGRPRAIVGGFGFQALLRGLSGDLGTSRLMALAMAERLRPRTPELRSLPTYLMLGELALLLRERALGDLVLPQIGELPAQGLVFSPGWPVFLPRLIGGLTGVRGDTAAARALLEDALQKARVSGALVEEALTEFELARVDDGRSEEHLDRGREIALSLGLPGLEARTTVIPTANMN